MKIGKKRDKKKQEEQKKKKRPKGKEREDCGQEAATRRNWCGRKKKKKKRKRKRDGIKIQGCGCNQKSGGVCVFFWASPYLPLFASLLSPFKTKFITWLATTPLPLPPPPPLLWIVDYYLQKGGEGKGGAALCTLHSGLWTLDSGRLQQVTSYNQPFSITNIFHPSLSSSTLLYCYRVTLTSQSLL